MVPGAFCDQCNLPGNRHVSAFCSWHDHVLCYFLHAQSCVCWPAGAVSGEGDATKDDRKKEEPNWYTLDNPARVVPAQEQYISFEETSRWRPLKHTRATAGFLMMKNVKSGKFASSVKAQLKNICKL